MLKMLSVAKADLVLTLVSRVLNPKSDTSGSGEVKAAAQVFTDESDALLARKKAPVWEAAPELDERQVMPGHNFYSLSTFYEKHLL